MNYLKYALISFLILFANLSFAQIVEPTNISMPEHTTKLMFLGNEDSFVDLDIDVKDLERWSKEVDRAFIRIFKQDIRESTNKIVALSFSLSAIPEPDNVCQKDYTHCVLISFNIQVSDNVSKEQLKKFTQEFSKIKEVKINNFKSKEVVDFALIMSTVDKNNSGNCNELISI